MIIRSFRVKRKKCDKHDKKILLSCDKCKEEFEMFSSSFKLGQKRHPGKHLCLMCANAREYKKIIIGDQNKKFKGGISPDGYRRIYYEGKNQFEHRVIAEKKLGRKLIHGEQVHHISCVKLNNSMDNLFIFASCKEHRKCHHKMEQIAMAMLNKRVWFNEFLGIYQTIVCPVFNPVNKYGGAVLKADLTSIIPQIFKKANRNSNYISKKGENRAIHMYIIEQIIGRSLYRNEVVHHIDGDTFNNSINNLYLCNRSEHKMIHESLSKCIAELYKKNIVGFDNDSGTYFLRGDK